MRKIFLQVNSLFVTTSSYPNRKTLTYRKVCNRNKILLCFFKSKLQQGGVLHHNEASDQEVRQLQAETSWSRVPQPLHPYTASQNHRVSWSVFKRFKNSFMSKRRLYTRCKIYWSVHVFAESVRGKGFFLYRSRVSLWKSLRNPWSEVSKYFLQKYIEI